MRDLLRVILLSLATAFCLFLVMCLAWIIAKFSELLGMDFYLSFILAAILIAGIPFVIIGTQNIE